jgi:hemoglobin
MKDTGAIILFVCMCVFCVSAMYIYSLRTKSGYKKRVAGSLYERLGGVFGIAAVVNNFSDALITNPLVGRDSPNPFLRDWSRNKLDRLPGLKFMRTLWVCAVSGGPFEYSPVRAGKCPFSLENAHMGLQISPEEFDEVAKELNKSMVVFGVPEKERKEVLNAFGAHKGEVVMGYDVANGIKPEDVKGC